MFLILEIHEIEIIWVNNPSLIYNYIMKYWELDKYRINKLVYENATLLQELKNGVVELHK